MMGEVQSSLQVTQIDIHQRKAVWLNSRNDEDNRSNINRVNKYSILFMAFSLHFLSINMNTSILFVFVRVLRYVRFAHVLVFSLTENFPEVLVKQLFNKLIHFKYELRLLCGQLHFPLDFLRISHGKGLQSFQS